LQGEDAGAGFGGYLLFGHDAMVVGVFGHAADAVAAHLRFGTVGIEHPHPHVSLVRRHDEDETVGADAEVAVGNPYGHLLRVSDLFSEAVHIDVIVAGTMHLGEFHALSPLSQRT